MKKNEKEWKIKWKNKEKEWKIKNENFSIFIFHILLRVITTTFSSSVCFTYQNS